MTDFNHGAFMRVLRQRRGTVPAPLYADLMAALDAGLKGDDPAPDFASNEAPWLVEARKHMGLREIPGAKHNKTILGWIKSLGGWFTDDETPWCGTFVAACMKAAGQPVPEHWYRAKAWASWGKPCTPCVGAVAVFGRSGGGHVGFLVGQSASNLYVLGGNQSNAVNIMPIAKTRLIDVRWPSSLPITGAVLPRMSGGTVSRNEA